jgi:nucleoside-diphosphate-sugar epimerase
MAVLGGRGWLGRAVVAAARRRRVTVTVVSRRPGPGAVAADPADTASLAAALCRADVVVNAAGYRGGDADVAAVANSELPDRLGWLAARSGWRLVHLGSAAEYGPSAAGPSLITEEHGCLPTSVYGMSKLAGTRAVLRWRARGAGVVVARVFNVADHDLPAENPFHGIAAQVRQVARAVGAPGGGRGVGLGGGPCDVGIGDPTTIRDVGLRTTLAGAIVDLAIAGAVPGAVPGGASATVAPPHPVVNVCTGRPTSFGDLAEAMARHLGVQVNVLDLGWPRGGRIVGDPTLLRGLVPLPPPDRLADLARSILGPPAAPSTSPELTGEHR